ncbi:MAG: PSP1 C-terminal domain-containing protein [Planctomycetota bacterium]
MGHVGRFDSVDGILYPRHARVICRTARGLEIGEVLSTSDLDAHEADGALVRRLTVEDDLLLTRIERNRDEAFRACNELLVERNLPAVLMDVEHLFDGQSLYFYFLGEISPEVESLTGELAAAYETQVQFEKFAETLTAGCGPGCGTEAATGQGCANGSCASCAVASACGSRGAAG